MTGMSRECDQCGMPEDHYGPNTMPLHKVPVGRDSSSLVCHDCFKTGVENMKVERMRRIHGEDYLSPNAKRELDAW